MTLQEVWSLLNLYNSSFSGEQIDEAIGVILNGGISAAVDAAQKSADAAAKSASEAAGSAASVGAAATNAQSAASRASGSATEAESYAHGGTGTREGEDEDNARYYAALTEAFVAALNAAAIDGRGHLVFIAPDGSTRDLGDVTGEDGSSIASITRTAGNGAPGTTDTYTVTLTDGSKTQFQVYNGKDGAGSGDMTAAVYDPQGKAQNIFQYVDEAIGKIPTPDVSAQIKKHNEDEEAHPDIREALNNVDPSKLSTPVPIEKGGTGAASAADARANLDVPSNSEVTEQIIAHNSSAAAHSDIRAELSTKAPAYSYGTEDIEEGVTLLDAGKLYFVIASEES
ncbi:MAG: hypothetical protein IKA50_01865 [Clostridia bacterium]|nr:hypothetical protein [Clostridia bacterium]